MNFKKQTIFLLVLGLMVVTGKTENISCYVCENDDCKDLNDDKLQMCGPKPTTVEEGSSTTEFSTSIDPSSPTTEITEEETQSSINPEASESKATTTSYRSRKLRSIVNETSYHCYKTIYSDQSGNTNDKRGCIAVPEELSACDMLESSYGNKLDVCKICTFDQCNSSATIHISWLLMTLVSLKTLHYVLLKFNISI